MVGRRLITAAVAAAVLAQGAVGAEMPGFGSASKFGPGVTRIVHTPGSPSNGRVAQDDDVNESPQAPKKVPRAYIVELESGKNSINGRSEGLHAQFHKRAEEENVAYKVRREFLDPSLFHGLSIQLDTDAEKETLEALPEVRRIWPVVEIAHPKPAGLEAFDLGGPVAPEYGFNTSVIRGKDYKIDYNLKMAGIEHLHSKGFKGKGVKVAIVDTGVDYRHPALGGGFGPGKKIAFGRNYVDDGQGGPDDPIATCASGGHGSHVAGIVAGEDPEDKGFGLLGVAPEATLGMYRVFSCGGGAYTDDVMQAVIDAVNDGANIISMSLGADTGFERDDPFGQIITGAKEQGVATIVAAGNAGHLGPFLTSSPAIASDAVAVASVDSARYPTTYKVKSNIKNAGEWRYSGLWPLEGEFNVFASPDYDESYGCTYDALLGAAAAVEAYGWNISDTFYMVRQGRCDMYGNVINAQYLGFKAVLAWRDEVYDNPYDNNYLGSAPPLNTISMDHIDGPKLYKVITANPEKFRLQFSDRRFLAVDNPSAGFTSNYSTFGNTWEFNVFKPLLAAPGHLILSAWPLEAGGYTIISGTSMATPFVAGCYALLKNALPDLSFEEITNLFSTTAQPAKWWGDDSITHSVSHQGAGTINVWKAYNSGAKFDSGALVLGQSTRTFTTNVTFTNTLGRSKTFEISHQPAGLMQRAPYADIDPVGYFVFGFPSKPIYAEVEFETPTKVTLGPGESAVVSFAVTPPKGIDPDTIPIYSGFIRFESGRDIYTVPYMGMPYVINEVPVLERDIVTDDPQLPLQIEYIDESGQPVWVKGDSVAYNLTEGDWVSMIFFSRQPADAYRIDLVAADTTFKPTYYGFNQSHVIDTTTPDLPVVDNSGGVDSLATTFGEIHVPPLYSGFSWSGWISDLNGDDVQVPDGDYRWLLRILPVEKDPEDADNWESWLGPVMVLGW